MIQVQYKMLVETIDDFILYDIQYTDVEVII